MNNVLLIGAGQLGSRHLQALLKAEIPLNITVIDPSEQSLEIAQKRAAEIESKSKSIILYNRSLEDLDTIIDFAIIATSSAIRLDVIKELISKVEVHNLLLEKVLFQSEDEYSVASELFEKHNVNVWVNCPRRMYPFYKKLKNLLTSNQHIHFKYTAGEWGLACNSIHLIDLATFLCGNSDWSIDTSNLKDAVESKRNGYKEVVGILNLYGKDGSSIQLISDPDINSSGLLTIIGETFKVVVDEASAFVHVSLDNQDWKEDTFQILYQSELTGIVLKELIETGDCSLTPYEESSKIHLPLIIALTDYFKTFGINGCPIT